MTTPTDLDYEKAQLFSNNILHTETSYNEVTLWTPFFLEIFVHLLSSAMAIPAA